MQEVAEQNEGIKEAQIGLNIEVIPSNIPDKVTCEIFGVKLRSECDYNLESEITDLNCNFNKNDIWILYMVWNILLLYKK